MAIWEATSEHLAERAEDHEKAGLNEAPPVQVIVVYDEPDTHLDYHHQREIMRLVREQSLVQHVSVVVATHSMNLIDGVEIHDVVLLRGNAEQLTVIERLGTGEHVAFDRHLGRIAASVGLRNSVLLHERCFFAVEGQTEYQVMPLLFKLAEGLSLQAAGIALWACGGNEGALSLASYLTLHNRSVLLMIDADSERGNKMFGKERLKRTFYDKHNDVVVMLGAEQNVSELEELFPDDVWARTANDEWPRPDGWNTEHFADMRQEKKFSSAVIEMIKEHSDRSPSGKPDMLVAVVSRLERAEEVPPGIADVFSKLRQMAG